MAFPSDAGTKKNIMERLRKMNKIAKALGYILYSWGGGTTTLWDGTSLGDFAENSSFLREVVF